jgi:outer membrane receptor protein involved in Fe transport
MKRFLLSLALVLCPVLAFAQGVTTGAMSGNVYSLEGEAVPGVRVVAKHLPSGTVYGAVSNSSGRFTFPALRIGGPYQVTATKLGLRPDVSDGISIQLGKTFNLAIVMVDETVKLSDVVVTAKKNAVLASERNGAATNVSTELIQQLPTLSRGIGDFTRMTPQANGLSFGGQDNRAINFTVDGSIFNNNFGLSNLPGGQTNSTPISLDAIEELQVNLSPYDVRQSGFTGAGINAVTRRGDNEFRGSVYGYTRNEGLVGNEASGITIPKNAFDVKQIGFRVGGPIIQDKLFFFINAEQETRTDPATQFVASRATSGETAPNIVRPNTNLADSLNRLRQFLIDRFQYDPGAYDGYNLETYSAKATARFDWNIDESQKFSVRYNYLRSYRDVLSSTSVSPSTLAIGGGANGRNGNLFGINFQNTNYRINNDINSVIAEYNATFGSEWSVNAIVGYTANRDYRQLFGSGTMPGVDILGPSGTNVATSFGNEQFTPNNVLNTDTWQFQANVTRYLGNHTLTAGVNFESFGFENGFTPGISGLYQFRSFQDFYNAVGPVGGVGQNVQLRSYTLWYSALPNNQVPIAKTSAQQLGFYLQDEWQPSSRFKVTLGVRADVPTFSGTELLRNPQVDTMRFVGGEQFTTTQLPGATLMVAPRIGFNWDATGDRTTQVRGGIGIFTGRVPFVVVSNQVSNTGMFNGTFDMNAPTLNVTNLPGTTQALRWSPNANWIPGAGVLNPNIPGNATSAVPPASYSLNITANDFKFPQIWRANFALDQDLGKFSPSLEGTIFTFEALVSGNLNAVLYRNANLREATRNFAGPDTRPRFLGSQNATTGTINNATLNRQYPNIIENLILDNTNQGTSYTATFQLQKTFAFGLSAMTAYTFGQSRDLADFGSTASGSFGGIISRFGNNLPELAFSSNDLRHRLIASLSYRVKWADIFTNADWAKILGYTTVSVFYEGRTQARYSYTYSGDMNGDGINGNDLMYVPRDASEVSFLPLTIGTGASARTFSPSQQWEWFNSFVSSDEYMNSRRGQYIERNGAIRPWLNRIDVSVSQDLALNIGGKENRLQFRVDIFNFGNMLNNKWGVADLIANGSPLAYVGAINDRPQFRLNGATVEPATITPTPSDARLIQPTTPFRTGTAIGDVWQMQIGIRYFFNDK